MPNKEITASLVIIGNEILSGRTEDKNINWLATELTKLGINVKEVRVIADIKQQIIDTIRACSEAHDYVFTTGGIGPTHDDITAESIAACFGVANELNAQAHQLLKDHYKNGPTEGQLKMAVIPVGAELLDNNVSSAPGFKIDNVYVMAGIPSIMQAMFLGIKDTLIGGTPTISKTITGVVSEGEIAAKLGQIQSAHPKVDIGSYPFIHQEQYAVSVVLRGLDEAMIDDAGIDVTALLADKGELIDLS